MNIVSKMLPVLNNHFYKISPAKNTVDGALAQLNTALDGLKKVKEQQDAEAERQAKIARDAVAAEAAANAEAARAARVIVKVENLLA